MNRAVKGWRQGCTRVLDKIGRTEGEDKQRLKLTIKGPQNPQVFRDKSHQVGERDPKGLFPFAREERRGRNPILKLQRRRREKKKARGEEGARRGGPRRRNVEGNLLYMWKSLGGFLE